MCGLIRRIGTDIVVIIYERLWSECRVLDTVRAFMESRLDESGGGCSSGPPSATGADGPVWDERRLTRWADFRLRERLLLGENLLGEDWIVGGHGSDLLHCLRSRGLIRNHHSLFLSVFALSLLTAIHSLILNVVAPSISLLTANHSLVKRVFAHEQHCPGARQPAALHLSDNIPIKKLAPMIGVATNQIALIDREYAFMISARCTASYASSVNTELPTAPLALTLISFNFLTLPLSPAGDVSIETFGICLIFRRMTWLRNL